ncbi:hypothetical protein AGDE_00939 [Angomonas deanei]|nr:hypothetical protein AGDE_00939 [Angomonas deanei]|eukprot:EPY42984.1 hypothetical protein AGDE_00939 [Angomonas deanei]
MEVDHNFIQVEDEEMELEDDEPLTKARLYYSTSEQNWAELGVGVVSIKYEDSAESGRTPRGGKVGPADSKDIKQVGKILLKDLDTPEEVILQTPISLDDIYVVQDDIILVWKDPLLAKELALSFSNSKGCGTIKDEIEKYRARNRVSVGLNLDNEKWAVNRENLPTILRDCTENTLRFGNFMKNNVEFVKQLVALFTVTKEEGNTALMDLIGQITLQLLQSPYSTDASVIAQFVEEASIDKVIDIVQFGLGRRSEETGFVSLEKRRATFRNPLQLKEPILSRIHLIYSAGYLKDMLPLNFEEDVMSPSFLAVPAAVQVCLMSDICASEFGTSTYRPLQVIED